MKKTSLLFFNLIQFFGLTVTAQNVVAGSLNVDLRADYNSTTYQDSTSSGFAKFHFKTGRLDYQAKATEQLQFRVRAAFNKEATDATTRQDSTQTSLEYAYLQHKLSDHFVLTMGKLSSELGGFEGSTSSADLYLVSEAYSHKSANGNLTSNVFATSDLLYMTGIKGTVTTEDGHVIHALLTNESSDGTKTGSNATQTATMLGLVTKFVFLDKALTVLTSYHTMGGAAKDDRYNLMVTGIQYKSELLATNIDYLNYEFKQELSGQVDRVNSVVGQMSYLGMYKWTPKVQIVSSEETIAVASSAKNKSLGYGMALEFKPEVDMNFNYHVAFNETHLKLDNGLTAKRQEAVVGVRFMADFLK